MPSLEHIRRFYSFFYVVVAKTVIEILMATWLVRGFFDMVLREIEWLVVIDGASGFKV